MQFSEVKQVKQVIGETNANGLLRDGWVLLAVVPATLKNGKASSALYVMGKSEPAKIPMDELANMTVGDLQRANQGL